MGSTPIKPPCNCDHCQAMDRLHALADVFEQAGNYAAADCCLEWAKQASEVTSWGQRLAAAVLYGRS